MTEELKTLIQRIARGHNPQAEDTFFKLINDQLRFIIRNQYYKHLNIVITTQVQEDILSEVRAVLLKKLREGKYDGSKGEPEAYATGIATLIIKNHFRKSKRILTKESEIVNEINDKAQNALDDLIKEERRNELLKCINQLKPKYRTILILRFIEERSNSEIAATLQLDQQRVREQIYYALKLLRKTCSKNSYFSIVSIFIPNILAALARS